MNFAQELQANANAVGAPVMSNGLLVNANMTLRHEEHIRYDATLIGVTNEVFNGIAHLRSRGLVKPLGGLGVIISMYERHGDMTAAEVSMDDFVKAQSDRIEFDATGVPIPIHHKGFSIGGRALEASRTTGQPLDTTQAEMAQRKVAESLEDSLWNGTSVVVDSKQVYGYRNFPQRNTDTLAYDWSASGTTGAQILIDLKAMVSQAQSKFRYGPFHLYVSKEAWLKFQDDYSASKGSNTILERLLKYPQISDVSPSPKLDADEVVMVQLTSDVVDLAVGQDITNLQWNTDPMNTNYKVFTAAAPRLKAEQDGNCGIFHWQT